MKKLLLAVIVLVGFMAGGCATGQGWQTAYEQEHKIASQRAERIKALENQQRPAPAQPQASSPAPQKQEKAYTRDELISWCGKFVKATKEQPFVCHMQTSKRGRQGMVFDFQNQSLLKTYWEDITKKLAGPYCETSNKSKIDADVVVFLLDENVFRILFCDTGKLSEWEKVTPPEVKDTTPTQKKEVPVVHQTPVTNKNTERKVKTTGKEETVPVKRYGNKLFYVPAKINNTITLEFLIDTGASGVVIPADVFLTLTRSYTIEESDLLPDSSYVLANGSKGTAKNVRIRTLTIGTTTITDVEAAIMPVESGLIIGQGVLEKLKGWRIDNERMLLIYKK